MSRLNPRDDRGAAVIVVALLLTSGLIMGLMTLVVDVGRLRVERMELRRAATAAVISAAYDCSFSPTTAITVNCAKSAYLTDPYSISPLSLANRNSGDGLGDVVSICGKDRNGKLLACPTPSPSARDCYRTPTGNNQYYTQVTVQTRTASGSKVPPLFSKVIPGYSGSTVKACAQAAWAAPDGLSITIGFALNSSCWKEQVQDTQTVTGRVTGYAPAPPYDYVNTASSTYYLTVAQKYERALMLPTTNTNNAADGGCGGTTGLPGGFGWLKSSNNACTATVTVGSYAPADTGISAQGCGATLVSSLYKMVAVPVYDSSTAAGYRIVGFAPFFLTGWSLAGTGGIGNQDPYITTPKTRLCKGDYKCIYGWFTQSTLLTNESAAIDPNRESYGLNVVKLVG